MTNPSRREVVDYLAAATDSELDALLDEARPGGRSGKLGGEATALDRLIESARPQTGRSTGLARGRQWHQIRNHRGGGAA